MSEQECVYWAELSGLGAAEPVRAEGIEFWLEDATGRVLVRPDRARVSVRAHRADEIVSLIDADIGAVSARIRELKQIRKRSHGKQARAALGEHKRLKKVATLLCAMRAHARGNVHVGGTLVGQAAYIRERSAALEHDGVATEAMRLLGGTFEVLIQDGQSIQVSGLCEETFIPPDVGPVGGYRDTPTCVQIRAPEGGELVITGLGELRPQPRTLQLLESEDEERSLQTRSPAQRALGWGIAVGVGWLLFYLLAG